MKLKTKIIPSFLVFAMILFVTSLLFAGNNTLIKAYADEEPLSGSGVQEDPYIISNADQLQLVLKNLGAYYKLINDIDLEGGVWNPVGKSSAYFKGNFDGNNHEIRNFKINSNDSNQGFFGRVYGATIKNLTLRNVIITGSSENVGALIGGALGPCNVTNCHIRNAEISGKKNVGGLIGYCDSFNINKCSVKASINADSYVGGLIGYTESSVSTKNCYAVGSVVGNYSVGGLIGFTRYDYHKITNCYSAVKVKGSKEVAALYYGAGEVTNCYYDKDVCGLSNTTNKNCARSTSQMYTKANFVNWDFNNIWSIDEGTSYPYFKDIDKPAKEDICLIRTKEELKLMKENNFSIYKLMNDIDLEGEEWEPIGTSEKPFKGTFYGNGYSISNFKINKTSDNQGLFGCTQDVSISDLTLKDITINGAKDNVGTLIGNAQGTSTITNCQMQNSTVSGESSVGGLVGKISNGTCTNCLSYTGVNGTDKNVGGLIGEIDGQFNMGNCYVVASVSGNDNAGGLVGYSRISSNKISNCYSGAKLNVIEGSASDTLAGLYNGEATVNNSYYDKNRWDISNSSNDQYARTPAEMFTKSNFVNWDFENVWSILEGRAYPYFKIKTKAFGVEDETISGILMDNRSGKIIENATIKARKDSKDGPVEKTVTTNILDFNGFKIPTGIFKFDNLNKGNYVLEISAKDYLTKYFEFNNLKGRDLGDIGMTHTLGENDMITVVLSWNPGENNKNVLKAYLESEDDDIKICSPEDNKIVQGIKTSNSKVSEDEIRNTMEIKFNEAPKKGYKYYIQLSSPDTTWEEVNANISLFANDALIKQFNVPSNLNSDDMWEVFNVDSEKEIVTDYEGASFDIKDPETFVTK